MSFVKDDVPAITCKRLTEDFKRFVTWKKSTDGILFFSAPPEIDLSYDEKIEKNKREKTTTFLKILNIENESSCFEFEKYDSFSQHKNIFWPLGTTTVILEGVPPVINAAELKILLRGVLHEYLPGMQITFEKILFLTCFWIKNENIKDLSSSLIREDSKTKTPQLFVTIEFREEAAARFLWCLCSVGAVKLYGSFLNCIPDPSRYKVFTEILAGLNPKGPLPQVASQNCPCCKSISIEQEMQEKADTELSFIHRCFLPCASKDLINVMKNFPSLSISGARIEWLDHLYGAKIDFLYSKILQAFCSEKYVIQIRQPLKRLELTYVCFGKISTPAILLEEASDLPFVLTTKGSADEVSLSIRVLWCSWEKKTCNEFSNNTKKISWVPDNKLFSVPANSIVASKKRSRLKNESARAVQNLEKEKTLKIPFAGKQETHNETLIPQQSSRKLSAEFFFEGSEHISRLRSNRRISQATAKRGSQLQKTGVTPPLVKRARGRPRGSGNKKPLNI